MKDFFPESLGQKHGCKLYMAAHYTQQNTVYGTHILLLFLLVADITNQSNSSDGQSC